MTTATTTAGDSTTPSALQQSETRDERLRAEVKSLQARNGEVEANYRDVFALYRLITEDSGRDLRGYVRTAYELFRNEEAAYAALFGPDRAPQIARKLPESTFRQACETFRLMIDDAPNDNISRTCQLATLFAAIVIEHPIMRSLLPEPEAAVRMFTQGTTTAQVGTAATAAATNEVERQLSSYQKIEQTLSDRTMVCFLIEALRAHFTAMYDGTSTNIELFVKECVRDFALFMPPYLPLDMVAQRAALVEARREQRTEAALVMRDTLMLSQTTTTAQTPARAQ